MLYLIPAPLHRLGLRVAHALRKRYRGLAKPHLAGVGIVLRDHEERLLLVRHSYGPRDWAIPGGGVKRGEDPALAARREIREELGCEIDMLVCVQVVEEELSGAPHTGHIYTARPVDEVQPDRRELVAARWFALHELSQIALTRGTARRLRELDLYSSDN